MRLVHLSDTHGIPVEVPDGDLLIHTGDFSAHGDDRDCIRFHLWMAHLPHPIKLLVPGNHDHLFETDPSYARSLIPSVTVLLDEYIEINGLRIFGTPWTLPYKNWAFMKTDSALARLYRQLTGPIDILASHGPAYGCVDAARIPNTTRTTPAGSRALRDILPTLQTRLLLSGHIHESYGVYQSPSCLHVNSSILNKRGLSPNRPHVIDLTPTGTPVLHLSHVR